jgi:hypothetical protein
MTNQIGFKGQTVYLDEDPKRGVCNGCRYVVGTVHPVSGKVYDVTHMHHNTYHDDAPLKDTIEECPLCHGRIRWEGYKPKKPKEMKTIRVEPEVQDMLSKFVERIGETYGDVVKRIAEHYAVCPEVKKEKDKEKKK